MRYLYTLLLYLLVPWMLLRLVWRSWREPGYLQNVGERFGQLPQDRRRAAHLGARRVGGRDARGAAPDRGAAPRATRSTIVLITHMTPTGREAGRELYGGRVDALLSARTIFPARWRRFLDHFKPHAGILMETEIWPNLIHACRRRSVPLYLVNARLSKKSWAGYRRFAGFTRRSLAGITAIAAQSAEDAERFTALGARNVVVTGSVKFDVTPPARADRARAGAAAALRRGPAGAARGEHPRRARRS